MYALDLVAAAGLGLGAFLGARKGLWRILAGGLAVSLGAVVAMAVSGALAEAIRGLGVTYPGDLLLGLFLPFALVSVSARLVAGLWLSKRLGTRPERNRVLGAVAGAAWMLFALGSLTRACLPTGEPGGSHPPFCDWLARYPGAIASHLRPAWLTERGDSRAWENALKAALDAERVQARAARADREARSSIANIVRREVEEKGDEIPQRSMRLRAP